MIDEYPDMPLLTQAMALLATPPFGLAQARELERLEAAAQGDEAALIGELWEAFYAGADEQALAQLGQGD